MSGRHARSERRKLRDYVATFFRDLEKFPGYSAGFYGGLLLVVLGVTLGVLGVL